MKMKCFWYIEWILWLISNYVLLIIKKIRKLLFFLKSVKWETLKKSTLWKSFLFFVKMKSDKWSTSFIVLMLLKLNFSLSVLFIQYILFLFVFVRSKMGGGVFFDGILFRNAQNKAKICWQNKSGGEVPVLDYNKLKQASNKCELPKLIKEVWRNMISWICLKLVVDEFAKVLKF